MSAVLLFVGLGLLVYFAIWLDAKTVRSSGGVRLRPESNLERKLRDLESENDILKAELAQRTEYR